MIQLYVKYETYFPKNRIQITKNQQLALKGALASNAKNIFPMKKIGLQNKKVFKNQKTLAQKELLFRQKGNLPSFSYYSKTFPLFLFERMWV